MWQERLLIRACDFVTRQVIHNRSDFNKLLNKEASISPNKLLVPFRQFSTLIAKSPSSLWNEQIWMESTQAKARDETWRAYFNVLSMCLQARIPLPCFNLVGDLLTELQRVANKYWAILRTGHKYPAANQNAPVVAEWAYQLVANWQSVCQLDLIGVEIQPDIKISWTAGLSTVGHLFQASNTLMVPMS